ncbi:energy transducer TonB [Hymenobacter rigui]|uniref:TonB family protein n=1 Tax=Hymenobacter rigui TaxID=334424 RepID=A0A3R9Q1Q1_9BACT|nr:energy transducer TonB [Hymenobacter rigui]RSK51092.1 TonB family protein [Hymenobacter rigui]
MYRFCWLLLAAICGTTVASAQTTSPSATTTPVYTYVEQMPVFPGGQEALLRTLGETIYYPTEALQQHLEGRIFVQFVVGVTGNVQDVHVSNTTIPVLDAAAVEAVQKLPAFSPGRQLGKPVPVAYTVPITFRIPSNVKEILAARAAPNTSVTPASSPLLFPGGPEALRTYLSNHPWPADYSSTLPSGTPALPQIVFVSFVVDTLGQVTQAMAVQPAEPVERRRSHQNPKVPAAPAALLLAAASHINAMPTWIPARKNGQKIPFPLTLPVYFGPTDSVATPLAYVDEMPVFKGDAIEGHYMAQRLRYPATALRSQTQGTVLTYFEVSEAGTIENIQTIKSASPDLDTEARRVVQMLPGYIPGRHNGKPARVFYVVPATFSIK